MMRWFAIHTFGALAVRSGHFVRFPLCSKVGFLKLVCLQPVGVQLLVGRIWGRFLLPPKQLDGVRQGWSLSHCQVGGGWKVHS